MLFEKCIVIFLSVSLSGVSPYVREFFLTYIGIKVIIILPYGHIVKRWFYD